MAGPGKSSMNRETLRSKLRYRGSGNFRRELEMAPENLVRRDLLRRSGNGYRFTIPLVQRWVTENKPFGRVRADLESLEPQAASLFKQGQAGLANGDLDSAEMLFRRALAINPNHVQARLLLGRVHLLRGNPAEAVGVIESAYGSDPDASREDLMAALLALAESQTDMDDQWRTLSRAARLEPNRPLIREKQAAVMRGWAQRAEKEGQYEVALKTYEELGDAAAAMSVRRKMFQQSLTDRLPGFFRFSTKS